MPRTRLKQLAQDGATDGQGMVWDNAAGLWKPGSIVSKWVQAINLNQASPYVQVTTGTYTAGGIFEFSGTDDVGSPTKISAVVHIGGGTDMDIRIQDVTNVNTICEKINITNVTPTIHDLGTISNLPTGPAVFEIQFLGTGGGSKARCSNVNLFFG